MASARACVVCDRLVPIMYDLSSRCTYRHVRSFDDSCQHHTQRLRMIRNNTARQLRLQHGPGFPIESSRGLQYPMSSAACTGLGPHYVQHTDTIEMHNSQPVLLHTDILLNTLRLLCHRTTTANVDAAYTDKFGTTRTRGLTRPSLIPNKAENTSLAILRDPYIPSPISFTLHQ
jgi:hypothetical protein